MKVLKWVLSAGLTVLAPFSLGAQETATFALVTCKADLYVVGLAFQDGHGRVRRVAFGEDGLFALKTWETKGLLSFSDTVAIHLRPPSRDSEDRFMTIEYRSPQDQANQIFEAGMVGAQCLKILKERFGTRLNFKEGQVRRAD